ncbi:endonuclease III domain-containing protein [Methanobacterium paludis]|uniref:Endonuclease III n=1 Tax=Methanobacterium paludis (strain DSM 25820 / JCM 18151 / SWAN1) TaxID=868131 RepID=F6D6P1_METPW|nr:endonuclease III [Methanobacterium paludis]AEG18324.1 HhH-GPD family protein [Methanobacterium paludis]
MVQIPKRIEEIVKRLQEEYTLRIFEDSDPFRVLIRTILSQRTRDENTDAASASLFARYPTARLIADAPIENIEILIKKSGFYHVKAKRVKEVSKIIHEEYDDVVPDDMKELLSLPGVGRKTANCVLVYGFHKDAIPVDVHVHRISNRIGLVDTKTPEQTEVELMKTVPRKYWLPLNDLLVQFGQTICRPIGPKHEICPIADLCDYYNNLEKE